MFWWPAQGLSFGDVPLPAYDRALALTLVLDPVWQETGVFWWPAQGLSFGDVPLPAYDRSLLLTLTLEVIGLLALAWAWRTFGLTDPGRRSVFLRTGRIDRAIVDGEPPTC